MSEPFSKIAIAKNCLKAEELERLSKGEHMLAVAVAREFGNSIAESTAKSLVESLILHETSMTTLIGTVDEWPIDSAGWTKFARNLVADNEACQRDISFNDATAIEAYKQAALSDLNPGQRINWARSGELDSYLNRVAREKLNESRSHG
jgi:hypothetical protein